MSSYKSDTNLVLLTMEQRKNVVKLKYKFNYSTCPQIHIRTDIWHYHVLDAVKNKTSILF